MHAVIETPGFIEDSKGLSEDERLDIIAAIAADPIAGDLMPGTGGARKRRFPGRGRGKRGGYRTVSYFAAEDVPVVLLALIDKGERADLSQAEKNALRERLSTFAATYRANVRRKVQERKRP
jgi:hypothetical protein